MLTSKPAWVAVMTHLNAETAVAERFREAGIQVQVNA